MHTVRVRAGSSDPAVCVCMCVRTEKMTEKTGGLTMKEEKARISTFHAATSINLAYPGYAAWI